MLILDAVHSCLLNSKKRQTHLLLLLFIIIVIIIIIIIIIKAVDIDLPGILTTCATVS